MGISLFTVKAVIQYFLIKEMQSYFLDLKTVASK